MKKLEEFEAHHGIGLMPHWRTDDSIIGIVLGARKNACDSLAQLDSTQIDNAIFLTIFNLTERAYEQLAAAYVCLNTDCAAAAEIIARSVIESSACVRYMALGDIQQRTIAWIRRHLDVDKKRIKQWRSQMIRESVPKPEVRRRVDKRRSALKVRQKYLEELEGWVESQGNVLGGADVFEWPSQMATIFEAIGETGTYRTAYSRLSSQVHVDPEDTLNYVMALLANDEQLLDAIGLETVMFSEYLVLYASQFYMGMLRDVCVTYKADVPQDLLAGIVATEGRMRAIGRSAGW